MQKTELEKAKMALKNAHSFLQKAIDKNDTQNETYFFEAVFRYSKLVDKLERQESIDQILSDAMFKSFSKYHGIDQTDKNDYQVGCIQTANALMPIIGLLLVELSIQQEKTSYADEAL